jgi:hypothetical protein
MEAGPLPTGRLHTQAAPLSRLKMRRADDLGNTSRQRSERLIIRTIADLFHIALPFFTSCHDGRALISAHHLHG